MNERTKKEIQTIVTALAEKVNGELAAVAEMKETVARVRRVCEICRAEEILARVDALSVSIEQRLAELREARQLLNGTTTVSKDGSPPVAASPPESETASEAAPEPVAAPSRRDEPVAPGVTPQRVSPSPAVPHKSPVPMWVPRELTELEQELQRLHDIVADLQDGKAADLAIFKAVGAFFRGAQMERQRHPGSQDQWNEFLRGLRERQRLGWGDRYCIPLAEVNKLIPPQWQALGYLYFELRDAQQALDWLEDTAPSAPENWLARDAASTLESVAAILSRFWRWNQSHLPCRREEQLQDLYERLRSLAAKSGVYLRALQPADVVSDTELECLASELQGKLKELRESTARRQAREEALAEFRALVETPGWGSREGDDERTCELAAACLQAGVPPTDRFLRDPLLECSWMLESEPKVARLLEAVQAEVRRREQRATEEEEEPRQEELPPEVAEMLEGVLPTTTGCRGVFIGGLPRDDVRRTIMETLKLAELNWPPTEPSDSFENSRTAIRKADIVFLTRFNRRKAREAYRICNEEDKLLVVLPKGYGLHEVIYRLHLRLC